MPGIDFLRLVLAVLLSLVLWLIVRTETNPERQDVTLFTVPVEVVNAPAGLQVTSDPPEVRISARATEDVWRRLNVKSFRVIADAARATRGDNNLMLRVEKL